MEEYKLTFETSSFMKKCNSMLLMPYEHKRDIDKGEYTINEAVLFSFPLEDLIIIEQDWCKIISKIRNGIAHEISEGDTIYLGACTKGANASSTREQPFSNIPAKQRAFSLKQSYMTYILKNYIFGTSKDENIIKDVSLLKDVGFESYIINKIKPFIGKTLDELRLELNITSKAKNINEFILAKILGVKGKITSTEEFQKANIIPKTIRINNNGSITESILSLEISICYHMIRQPLCFLISSYNKMIEIGRNISSDINGDGVYGAEDIYGMACNSYGALTYTYGSDVIFAQKDSDDIPYLDK